MDAFIQKQLTTKRSLKYNYFVSPSGESTPQHPALLFVHGFPDSSGLWKDVIAKLGNLPNKIIVPDLLGYGRSDRPTNTELYAYNLQADDLAEILEAEQARHSIIIGHDWGSAISQRTFLHKRKLFVGIVLVNVGYMVPSEHPFDLASANEMTTKLFGYPQFDYWNLFTAPDAEKVLTRNLEKTWQVWHGDESEWMKKMFCTDGAMRKFLLDDTAQVPLKAYAHEPRWRDEFFNHFKVEGAFNGALQNYKATVANVNYKSDLTIPRDKLTLDVPILFIVCTGDSVCVPEIMTPAKQAGLVPDLKEVVIESAHWSPMEKPGEIAQHMTAFLNERFAHTK